MNIDNITHTDTHTHGITIAPNVTTAATQFMFTNRKEERTNEPTCMRMMYAEFV